MTLRVWQFVNILLSSLVVSVFWGPWLGLSRSIATFTPETFLAIGKTFIGNLAPIMPILMLAAILSTIPVLVILYRQSSNALLPTLLGFALFITALSITLLGNVPIDNQIKQWTVESLPENWQQIRDRWETFHVMRTFASIVGLALLLGAALLVRGHERPTG